MAITTFDELKTATTEWLAHDDVTARVEDLISFAEASFNRSISLRQQFTATSGTLASTGIITLPTDYLELQAFNVDGDVPGKPMTYLPPREFRDSGLNSGSGFPTHYTITNDSIKVIQTPDSTTTYTYYLDYLARLPALTVSNQTNWLLTIAPDLYLYKTLLQCEPYLHNDERIVQWQTMADRAVAELQGQDARSKYRPGVTRITSYTPEGTFRRT